VRTVSIYSQMILVLAHCINVDRGSSEAARSVMNTTHSTANDP